MATIQCVVVTPEKTELKTDADSIVVPLFDGQLGILAGRAPMIGRLGFGILKLVVGGSEKNYYVDGGFVQVTGNVVYILTDRLADPASFKKSETTDELQNAMAMPGDSVELMQVKERAVTRARARDRLARA